MQLLEHFKFVNMSFRFKFCRKVMVCLRTSFNFHLTSCQAWRNTNEDLLGTVSLMTGIYLLWIGQRCKWIFVQDLRHPGFWLESTSGLPNFLSWEGGILGKGNSAVPTQVNDSGKTNVFSRAWVMHGREEISYPGYEWWLKIDHHFNQGAYRGSLI